MKHCYQKPIVTRTPWTAEEEYELRRLWSEGHSTREIARHLNRTRRAVKLRRFKLSLVPRIRGKVNQCAPTMETPDSQSKEMWTPYSLADSIPLNEEVLDEARNYLWNRERNLLHRDQVQEARRVAFEERFLQLLGERVELWRPECSFTPRPSREEGRASNLHAVLLLSDLHIGQRFGPEETDGRSAYSPLIFLSRLQYLETRLSELAWMIPSASLHLLFLGDIVHGMLQHSAEREETLLLIDQFSLAIHSLFGFLSKLSGIFPKVVIQAVSGNHGRFPHQRKMPTVARHSNFDSLVYRGLEAMCQAAKMSQITFRLHPASRQIVAIGGSNIHMLHGDQIRGGGEVPHRGMTKEAASVTFRQAANAGTPVDLYVMGDKHRPMSVPVGGGQYIVNGSFPGSDQFGMNFIPVRPSQTLFWIAEGQGKTLQSEILLDLAPALKNPGQFIPPFLHRLLS